MKIFFRKEKLNKNNIGSGYTLLEVVLVMAFVSISFMSLYGIFAKTIQGDTESRNEIIASNLAQECIERVRNCRDNQLLVTPTWAVSALAGACGAAANPVLSFSSGGTTFTTSLAITDGPISSKIVTCTTSWNSFLQPGLTRSVVIKSLLSDWQKQ